MASLARPSPPLRLNTGSDTSSVERGGLASQTSRETDHEVYYTAYYLASSPGARAPEDEARYYPDFTALEKKKLRELFGKGIFWDQDI